MKKDWSTVITQCFQWILLKSCVFLELFCCSFNVFYVLFFRKDVQVWKCTRHIEKSADLRPTKAIDSPLSHRWAVGGDINVDLRIWEKIREIWLNMEPREQMTVRKLINRPYEWIIDWFRESSSTWFLQDFMCGTIEEHRRSVDGSKKCTAGPSFNSEKVLSGEENFFQVWTDEGSRWTIV